MSLHNQSLFRWNIRDINVLINKMEEKAFATGFDCDMNKIYGQ